jgi:hypothetical protein
MASSLRRFSAPAGARTWARITVVACALIAGREQASRARVVAAIIA